MMACDWQWATIPLSLLISFALLGIEAASIECERPFAAQPTKNHHDLERFAQIISTEVQHMLERANKVDGPPSPMRPQRKPTLYGLSDRSHLVAGSIREMPTGPPL